MPLPPEGDQGIPEGARAHLARVLASPLFERSPRQSSFLRFVVEKVLAGEQDQIKEYEIAVNVYGRRTDHSTRADPIVRVEASRLRSKLLEYYSTEGRHEEFHIELPKGTYVPEFVSAPLAILGADDSAACAVPDAPDFGSIPKTVRPHRKVWWIAATIAGTVAAGWLLWTFAHRNTGSPLLPPHSKVPSSIAVLPVQDQTPGLHQQQLADGLTEALISEMRQRNMPHWHIRSAIINGDPTLAQQRADAVFRGSFTVNGGILRVMGSLQHLPSKTVLWNGAVERKLAEWPESERGFMFEDIAYAITESFNNALMERQEEEMAAVYPRRVEARHAWLEADLLWRRGDAASVRKAIGLLEKATALDPNFGWIHATLADAYVSAVELGLSPEATFRRRAHEEAERALKLGPYLAPSNAVAARVSLILDWNIQAASARCTSALNMLSGASSVRGVCAEVFSLDSRNEAAAALDLRSIRRSPTTKLFALTDLAWVRYRARQFDEARSLAEQALSFDKNYAPARRVLTLAQMLAHHPDQALAVIQTGAADQSGRLQALAATAFAMLGQRQAAETELVQAERQLVRPDRTDLVRPYLMLGLTDRAKAVIEEATGQRNASLLELMVDPQIIDLDRDGLVDRIRPRARN